MCDQDQDQPYIAPGFDANLHDCSFCNDTGISQETAGYCTACRMGKRIEQLDQFAEQLKGHGFTEAMRIVFRSTQRTEKAIAATDKALMMAHQKAKEEKIAELEKQLIATQQECIKRGNELIEANATNLAQLLYATALPEGWQIVPKEPTPEMMAVYKSFRVIGITCGIHDVEL